MALDFGKPAPKRGVGYYSARKGALIEITPAMLAAGVRVIADEYGVCSEHAAEGLAADVFRAMIAAHAQA